MSAFDCANCRRVFSSASGLTRHRSANEVCRMFLGLAPSHPRPDLASDCDSGSSSDSDHDMPDLLDGEDDDVVGRTPAPVPAQEHAPASSRVKIHGVLPLEQVLVNYQPASDSWTRNELYRMVARRTISKGQLFELLGLMRNPLFNPAHVPGLPEALSELEESASKKGVLVSFVGTFSLLYNRCLTTLLTICSPTCAVLAGRRSRA